MSFREAVNYLNIDSHGILKREPEGDRQKDLLTAYRAWLRSFYRKLCKQEQILYSLLTRSRGHPFQKAATAWEYAELISELPLIELKIDIIWNGTEEEKFNLFMEENHIKC